MNTYIKGMTSSRRQSYHDINESRNADSNLEDSNYVSWKTELKNYQNSKLSPFKKATPQKRMRHSDVKMAESSYNPILQTFSSPAKESSYKTQSQQRMIDLLAKNRDTQIRYEQIYNIINQESKLTGLERASNFPKQKTWQPKYIKNTKQDHNIVSNLPLADHHFNAPDQRPQPDINKEKGSGVRIVRRQIFNKDFDLITNRYLNHSEAKSLVDREIQLKEAALKYEQKNQFDPVKCVYNDPQKETLFIEDKQKSMKEHGLQQSKKLPDSIQREGLAYNHITNEVIDNEKLKFLDDRSENRIKRFHVKAQFEQMNRSRIKYNHELSAQRNQNKATYERFRVQNDRGYDILSTEDLNSSTNIEAKNEYYQMIKKPETWKYISDSQSDIKDVSFKCADQPQLVSLKRDASPQLTDQQKLIQKQFDATGFAILKREDRLSGLDKRNSMSNRAIGIVRTGAFSLVGGSLKAASPSKLI